jgi:hypothetical protein
MLNRTIGIDLGCDVNVFVNVVVVRSVELLSVVAKVHLHQSDIGARLSFRFERTLYPNDSEKHPEIYASFLRRCIHRLQDVFLAYAIRFTMKVDIIAHCQCGVDTLLGWSGNDSSRV